MAKIRGVKPDYWTDEDIVELSIPARLLFIGLWNYACDNGHLQDKPKQIKMRIFPGDDVNATELLRELADKGSIQRGDGWITIPNLTKHQKPDRRYFATCERVDCLPPPETVSQRESRRVHAVQPTGTPSAHAVCTPGAHVDGDGDGEVMVSGGDGDSPGELTPAETPRPDVEQICEHLASAIEANGSNRPTITAKWRTSARLMLDKDGRTKEEIHGAIDWCQRDEFWRSNILSLPTLREKYEQLRLQAQRKHGGTGSRTEEWRSMQERQMERAIEREKEMGLR